MWQKCAAVLLVKFCKKVIDSKTRIIYNIFIRKILNNVRYAHPDSFCQIFQTLIK